MIGEEIQRARTLLAAVIREGLLDPEAADRAYEEWVAGAEGVPFSRFLIARGLPAEAVRRELRRAAVVGLPSPDLHTYERFEDLLMGQLGVEAGLLSPKLLRSVRAVQDKKLAEGKLRRLEELLPRAGYDPHLLALLAEHLRERLLLCPGCLGRYPRRDLGAVELECPRCGATVRAEALEPAPAETALGPGRRHSLLASSEHLLATRNRDASVSEREERSARSAPAEAPLVALVAALALLVVGGLVGLVLLQSAPSENRSARRTVARSEHPRRPRRVEEAEPGARSPTAAEARAKAARLVREGRYAEAIAFWERVRPGPGEAPEEVAAQRRERLEALRAWLAAARTAEELVAGLAGGELAEDAEARARTCLAGAPPGRPPPFDRLARALRRRVAERRRQALAAAERRLETARARPDPEAEAWRRRAAAARRARPLYGLRLAGREAGAARILDLDATGYRLQTSLGAFAASWKEAPQVGLRVLRAVADPARRCDRLALLRQALLAREAREVERLAPRLGFAEEAQALLAQAPTAFPPERVAEGGVRVRWGGGRVATDLSPAEGTTLRGLGTALRLEGAQPRLATRRFPLSGRGDGVGRILRVRATLEAEGTRSLGLRFARGGSERGYTLRWGEGGWRLEVDFGAAATVLAEGPLDEDGGRAELELAGEELSVSIAGRVLGRARAHARGTRVWATCGASGAPLFLRELALEGSLDAQELEAAERRYARAVDLAFERAALPLGVPALDPACAEALGEGASRTPELQARLDEGLRLYLSGRAREAERVLEGAEGSFAAQFLSALCALRRGEAYLALARSRAALRLRPRFPAAHAAIGLVFALFGREGPAREHLDAAAAERPDLAFLPLARAWLDARPGAGASALGAPEDDLSLARALAPGDPLVRRVELAWRAAHALAGGAGAPRSAGAACLVRAATDEVAAAWVPFVEGFAKRCARILGHRGREERALEVLLLDPTEFGLRAPKGVDAAYFDLWSGAVLASRSVDPSEPATARACARALAEAECALRYGATPPWLESGLCDAVVARLERGPPHGPLVDRLRQAAPWDEGRWQRLLGLSRSGLRTDPEARARAFAWVWLRGPLAFGEQLRACAGGRPPPPPEVDPEALEERLRHAFGADAEAPPGERPR